MEVEIQYYKTDVGELILGTYNGALCLLDWRYRKMRESIDNRIKGGLQAEFVVSDNKILEETRLQISQYLKGERKEFTIPLLMVGSDFQKSVWNALTGVKYGETSSYLELSRAIGNEKAIRAVASANGANAISIIIPCHRIIGSDGKLVGYAGGLAAKRRLLELEEEHTLYRGSLL